MANQLNFNLENSKKIASGKKEITVKAPGRINIIGEHTDYNEGFVLPAAVDKRTIMKIQRNNSPNEVHVEALNVGAFFQFSLDNFAPLNGGWQNYIMGVVNELQKLGAELEGFNAQFEGNVPIGGGMSSSASLECSLAFGLNELFNLRLDPTQLIKASQMAEHNFVGIKCGIMDQFASVMGKKDHVILLDCRTFDYEYFPLILGDYELLLLNTNVSHALASSEYNTRRSECEQGVALLKKKYPAIATLRDVELDQLIAYKNGMPAVIYQRCHHVVSENQRVLDATKALKSQNTLNLGALMYQSHFSLQHDYEVSCPELDFLVDATTSMDFVLGSRMMGGGFGGCTISIIKKERKNEFVDLLSTAYQQKFGIDLTPYSVSIEDGTKEI